MKHIFENGKWMPENGTFVSVPNEEIPEVIQLLRDNGQPISRWHDQKREHVAIWFNYKAWNSLKNIISGDLIELPFPDFKALVTGKLPESWCIQCTEESMKHEAWVPMINSLNEGHRQKFNGDQVGKYYSVLFAHKKPSGEVLQIETWAALNPVEESTEKWIPNEQEQKSIAKDIRSHIRIGRATNEQLIEEMKSRGYTVSKIY